MLNKLKDNGGLPGSGPAAPRAAGPQGDQSGLISAAKDGLARSNVPQPKAEPVAEKKTESDLQVG